MSGAVDINPDNHVEPDDCACANCKWWEPPVDEVRPTYGVCRGAPPTAILVGDRELVNARPTTARGDYCGAFQPRVVDPFQAFADVLRGIPPEQLSAALQSTFAQAAKEEDPDVPS